MAQITYTLTHDTGLGPPKRGDMLQSSRTSYWILRAVSVVRRSPAAPPQFKLTVARAHELEDSTVALLQRRALRSGLQFKVHPLYWNSRSKK